MTSEADEKNKALVRRFFNALEKVSRDKADLDALDEMMAPDFVGHYKRLPGQQPDREGYKRALAELRVTATNPRYLIEEQVAGEDKVVSRFILRVTHDRGELMGIAPTGREVASKVILIHRIEGVRSPRSGAWERSARN